MHRFSAKLTAAVASAVLALCGLPSAALAGENATAAAQQATDAAIQDAIDGLSDLEAGEDYIADEVLVTYSGEDEPQTLELDCGQSVADALQEAKANDMVTAAQPNYVYRLMDKANNDALAGERTSSTVDDKFSSGQYYLGACDQADGYRGANVTSAWALAKSNNSVVVAVLDTGVQLSHEDLATNVDRTHMATATSDGRIVVGDMIDEDCHGTHVAGILAATANNEVGIAGTSYNATVLPIRVFENHTSTTLQCVTAIRYLDGLVESGEVSNLHVMNMSLGSYSQSAMDDLLHEEISHMREQHGIVSVCAGGNGINGVAQTRKCVPADWEECVSVTSLDAYGYNSTWSDYNRYKDISAPGEAILSAYTDEYARAMRKDEDLLVYRKDASYGFMEGTSMAAPLVSGVMALLWATYPALSVDEAVATIKNTATEVPLRRSDVVKELMSGVTNKSAGAIDAAAAVAYVQQIAAKNGVEAISEPGEQPVVSTKPAKAKGLKLVSAQQTLKVKWSALDGVAGYQLRYRQKGKSAWKTKAVRDSLADATTIKSLSSGKRYQVQLRAYRLKASGSGKLYGSWSATKTAKAKYQIFPSAEVVHQAYCRHRGAGLGGAG